MAIKSDKAVKISQKHLLGIQDLSISDVNLILNEAKQFINLNKSKNKKLDTLKGKTKTVEELRKSEERITIKKARDLVKEAFETKSEPIAIKA